MSRLNLADVNLAPATPATSLDILVENYARQKEDLDELQKVVDAGNSAIKEAMQTKGLTKYDTPWYTAKCTENVRTTIDQEKLLAVAKKFHLDDCIKTMEYVDGDLLENRLYHEAPSPELADALDQCSIKKPYTVLKVTRRKDIDG